MVVVVVVVVVVEVVVEVVVVVLAMVVVVCLNWRHAVWTSCEQCMNNCPKMAYVHDPYPTRKWGVGNWTTQLEYLIKRTPEKISNKTQKPQATQHFKVKYTKHDPTDPKDTKKPTSIISHLQDIHKVSLHFWARQKTHTCMHSMNSSWASGSEKWIAEASPSLGRINKSNMNITLKQLKTCY